MRNFKFRLERVLAVRDLNKFVAEEKLGRLLRDMYLIRNDLNMATAAGLENCASLRKEVSGQIDLPRIKALLRYGAVVDKYISVKKEELAQKERSVRKAQEEVLARTQEKRALERLKERQISRYRALYWWEQSKQLDEIGSVYFGRNAKEVI
ncbi:MAG TPA: hypothetical protein GX524_02560 [Firmicutes bacterium]|nr:hypothetical protein [Bacillota bacterium]